MANQTGESSSAATKKPLYSPHVFLSFAGKDTRHGFTSHLYAALRKRGIKTFRDDKTTRKGQFFGEEVEAAIKESKICIVVFSEGYRYSKWCLIELELIHECVNAKEPHNVYPQIYPIFYKIEPSDIRDETKFEIAMKELNKKQKAKNKPEFSLEQMKKWWDALLSVGGLQGYPLQEGFDEAELIERIVTDVFKLVPKLLDVGQHIVGLESRVQEVKSLLDIGSESSNNSVCMLLIHGIGGIGKTTLAKLLYNEIVYQFKGASFLFSVKEATSNQPNGLASLQKLLLKEAHGEDIDFGNDAEGASKMKELLCNKKILLVLDDVDDKKQLNKLAVGCDWFGSGSRIIITSRNSRLLNENQDHNKIYEMKEINDSAALECLCWYAFDDSQPAKGFENVTKCVVTYAKGLPLALEVIGSDLNGEGLEEWKRELRYYEKNQHRGILCVLERSYYRLDPTERQIFLDIACFFKGKRKIHVEMLSYDCEHAIAVLEKRSLIKVTSGFLRMHDLIQQMGKEIVLKENPGQPNRLWDYEDCVDTLINDSGADKIKGMNIAAVDYTAVDYLDPDFTLSCLPDEQRLCGTAFCKMKNLQTLIVKNVTFSQPPPSLPNKLSWLKWISYPSATLPSDFRPNRLVVLELPHSQDINESVLGPWEGTYLSCLNLSFCPSLHVIPDMSRFPNLRELILSDCENLTKVDDSVGSCSKLIRLDFSWCQKLEYFPHKIKFPSLEFVDLSYCKSLQHFPDIEGQINTLESIKLFGLDKIEKLPESISNITRLKVLSLRDCSELKEILLLKLRSLEKVTIRCCPRVSFRKSQAMQENDSEAVSCPNLRKLSIVDSDLSDDSLATILSCCQKLECLTLSGTSITSIPQCIEELVDLRVLDVSSCDRLQNILGLPSKLSTIHAYNCESLTSDSATILLSQACKGIVGLHISFDLPESEISIPSQFRCLSNCAGIVSFQIGQIFPFAAFAFILKRVPGPADRHPNKVRIFINDLLVIDTFSIILAEGVVEIVDLQNFDKTNDLGAFLVNDWNDVDIQVVFNCEGKCSEQLEVYGVLCNEEQIARCPLIWHSIWNWPGPQRIRDFLWLLVQEKLFTNSQRRSQQLTDSDNCPRCGSSGETVMHMIRDCESITNLWQKIIKPCHWECFSSTSVCLRGWVLMNLSTKLGRDDGLDWKVTFGFACWNIWENRNDLAVDNLANGAIDHGDRARESIEAISRAIKSQSHARLERLNSWKLPPNDWVKLNGIIFPRGNVINCGCAFQDATGSWIFELVTVPDQDILEYLGEYLVILIGLLIARMKGFDKIIIEIHDRNWFQLFLSDGPVNNILRLTCCQVHIFQTNIGSEDISRKMADLVHNSEQYSFDFAILRELYKQEYAGGLAKL